MICATPRAILPELLMLPRELLLLGGWEVVGGVPGGPVGVARGSKPREGVPLGLPDSVTVAEVDGEAPVDRVGVNVGVGVSEGVAEEVVDGEAPVERVGVGV